VFSELQLVQRHKPHLISPPYDGSCFTVNFQHAMVSSKWHTSTSCVQLYLKLEQLSIHQEGGRGGRWVRDLLGYPI
jgi:hypothetical protein